MYLLYAGVACSPSYRNELKEEKKCILMHKVLGYRTEKPVAKEGN